MAISLSKMAAGQKGKVAYLSGEGTALRRRLLDMGLTPGTELTMIRTAPLGDPLELSLRGYALTLRVSDARLVNVEVA